MSDPAQTPAFRNLDRVMDLVGCGLLASDENGNIVLVNQRLLRWLALPPEEIEGRPIEDLVPAELRDIVQAERMAEWRGDLRVRLTVLQRSDSTTFPVLAIPHGLLDEDGRRIGTVVLIIDLGAVQTAKSVGYPLRADVSNSLQRIAVELELLSLSTDLANSGDVPLSHPDLKVLTRREKEVLALLVGAGERVPHIAVSLSISAHTVRSHLKSIFRKLEVRDQAELMRRVRSLRS